MSEDNNDQTEDEGSDELERQERAQDLAMVKKHAQQLMSRFDTVQIICTKHHPDDGTIKCVWGAGNYYARVGSVREWMKEDHELIRQNMQRDEESDDA